MRLTSKSWSTTGAILLISCAGLLGACQSSGGGSETRSDAAASGEDAPEPETAEHAGLADADLVPGFGPGEFPEVPMFEIPDLTMLDESRALFAIEFGEIVGDYPGLIISPARCDEAGSYEGSGRTVVTDGEGGASSQDGAESKQNDGQGAGSYSDGSLTVVNNGDGSGSYSDGALTVTVNGDGSGSYSDGALTISVDGEGSGSYSSGATTIANNGDGSGSLSDGATTIANNGDGSGSYSAGATTIQNDGNGTAIVNGSPVDADPLPPLPPAGDFPSMEALEPVDSCGVTITLEDGVLFDFDRSELRAEASEVIDRVAAAMGEVDAPRAEVSGHTDGKGSDDYNQTLSEDRANAVTDALRDAGVRADLEEVGYGKTKPVAPNEIDGKDNPAGRQLNRRVEIFIPQI